MKDAVVTSGLCPGMGSQDKDCPPEPRGAQALERKRSGWLLSPSTHPPTKPPGISRAALPHTPQHCHLTEAGIAKPAKDLSWVVARAMGVGVGVGEQNNLMLLLHCGSWSQTEGSGLPVLHSVIFQN